MDCLAGASINQLSKFSCLFLSVKQRGKFSSKERLNITKNNFYIIVFNDIYSLSWLEKGALCGKIQRRFTT